MAKNRKPHKKGKKLSPKSLKDLLARKFSRHKTKIFTTRQLSKKLKSGNNADSVQHAIDELIKQGLVYEVKEGKYRWDRMASVGEQVNTFKGKTYTGKVDAIKSGAAYIITDDLEDDIYVPSKFLKGALNGDIVEVEVPKIPGKRKPEGKVLKIVKRSLTHILGRLRINDKYGIVYPIQDIKIGEVWIHQNDLKDAEDGQPVVVEITNWGTGQNKALWGKIDKVLHDANENDMAMQGILLSNGFELDFPPEVLEQVAKIEPGIDEEGESYRRDFRKVTTFTIDPLTAKDFDDAISFDQIDEGTIEIGVHIADVTHYVPEGSPLDKEALNRSTSVYLVDRVLPMLPEKLSNDLCSLNPKVDRYTFSAVFTFDKDWNIIREWFGRTIIHSDRRFTYEEAQEIIETGKGDYAREIKLLNKIAQKLRKDKFKNGAISFESDEIQFELDENGKPIGMTVKERKDAHMLVEDFMLLANKSVAKFIAQKSKNEIPFIYRVHDLPNPDRLADFATFAKELGFNMKLNTPNQISKSFNQLYKASASNEQLKLLEPLAIRTMAKAEYTTENIGHYGLAFDFYTHFTSPIRRYSDVLVHRILDKNLHGEHRVDKEDLEQKAKHISLQERKATDAERESVKYKQVEYIEDHVGDVFEGVINGMIDRGIFVELIDSKAEGMVSFDRMDEPFEMQENRLKAVGKKTGKTLHFGQQVSVQILSADLDRRQIEMKLVESN